MLHSPFAVISLRGLIYFFQRLISHNCGHIGVRSCVVGYSPARFFFCDSSSRKSFFRNSCESYMGNYVFNWNFRSPSQLKQKSKNVFYLQNARKLAQLEEICWKKELDLTKQVEYSLRSVTFVIPFSGRSQDLNDIFVEQRGKMCSFGSFNTVCVEKKREFSIWSSLRFQNICRVLLRL